MTKETLEAAKSLSDKIELLRNHIDHVEFSLSRIKLNPPYAKICIRDEHRASIDLLPGFLAMHPFALIENYIDTAKKELKHLQQEFNKL